MYVSQQLDPPVGHNFGCHDRPRYNWTPVIMRNVTTRADCSSYSEHCLRYQPTRLRSKLGLLWSVQPLPFQNLLHDFEAQFLLPETMGTHSISAMSENSPDSSPGVVCQYKIIIIKILHSECQKVWWLCHTNGIGNVRCKWTHNLNATPGCWTGFITSMIVSVRL